MRHCLAFALAVASCHPGRGSSAVTNDAAVSSAVSVTTAGTVEPGLLPASPTASSVARRVTEGALIVEAPAGALHHRFRKTSLTVDGLSRLVAAAPELGRTGGDVAFFDPGDTQFLSRSKADREGVTFTTLPIVWNPEAGAELLVLTGHGRAASFVAAWWILPGGEYRLASSFVMLGEVAPVALAYRPEERTLYWTSCWQCPGETGHVSLREDHHVVIVQD
ncbi:MAG: hypothetical protein ACLP1X_14295 [Polyangiaceae bacterium]